MQFRPLLALVFFVWQYAGSQSLYFKHLGVNEGLSQAVNNCIYRDSKGFIWISSFDGLNRFDGLNCKVFRSGQEQSQGLRGTLFLNILEDQSSNIWIGSNQGLNMYDRDQERFYNFVVPNRDNEQFYSPVYIDQDQTVWVQSGPDIFRFHPDTRVFEKLPTGFTASGLLVKAWPQTAMKKLQQLLVVPQGRAAIYRGIWAQTHMQWDSILLPESASPISNLLPETSQSIWIGTRQGLYHWQPGQLDFLKWTNQWHVTALLATAQNGLWIGTQRHGLIQTDPKKTTIANQYVNIATSGNSLSGNQVQYILNDSTQNIWVSVWGKGIDYCNQARFRFTNYITRDVATAHGTDNFIRAMIQVGSQSWCGTQAGGIVVVDSSQQIIHSIQNGLPPAIEHLHLVMPGQVWAATSDGLFKISASNFRVSRLSKPGIQFNFVGEAGKDHALISANNGLFIGHKKTGRIIPVKGAAKEVWLTSHLDKNGYLYLSRPFKGFSIHRLAGDSLITIKNIPLNATIKCFYESNSNILWIGSTQGLIKFNTTSFQIEKIFTTADGLSNQYIYGIVPHGDDLWLSTNAGLNRFHGKNFSNKIFTANDGLQSNEFNTYAFGKNSKGLIQFGGINGLNAFDPSVITNRSYPPQLQLTRVLVNDSSILQTHNGSQTDSLLLPYSQNTISFQFTVLHYDHPAANSIQYQLEPYDKSWVEAGNKTVIRYAKLPAGNYRLLVKAFNANGQSSVETFQLPITVLTPWWQSWWFRALLLVLAIALTAALVKFYTHRRLVIQRRQMEKELAVEQERTRMARDLHDGLGGMLSGIKHVVAALALKTEAGHSSNGLLSKTLHMLDESIVELRRVAYNMTPPSLSADGLDSALRDFCSSVSVAEGLQVRYQSIGMDGFYLKETSSLAIYRIVQELVNNIIKHANANEALVQLIVQDRKLSITVEDNGSGFDAQQLKYAGGMGWKNIHNRVAALPGIIDLQTAAGKGSSVYVEINLS